MVYLKAFYHSLWNNSTLSVRIHEIFIGPVPHFPEDGFLTSVNAPKRMRFGAFGAFYGFAAAQ